ncbi:MAG: ABC transporter ATP-binding protein [Proteobacteria bacterium]|nr:ABC transporter ATP-binding protein [Pseudomonadota bacterium]
MLTSFTEGIGISLFIPFLESIGQKNIVPQTGNWLIDSLGTLFNSIQPDTRLLTISFCIFIVVLLRAAMSYGNMVTFTWLTMKVGHRIRSSLFEQLMTVSFRFIEKCSSGRLMNALSTETWRATDALSGLFRILIGVCSIAVYFTLLMLISWKLTLLVTAIMVVISVIVRLLTHQTQSLGEKVTLHNTELTNRMVEGIEGMKVIRSFVRESYEQKRFAQTSRRLTNLIVRLTMLHGTISPVYQVLTAALLLAVLLTNIHSPERIHSILVFIFILYRLQPRIIALDGARNRIVFLASAVEEINSLLAETIKSLPNGTIPFKELKKGIFFNNLTFKYNSDEKPALQNISVSIPVGKTTALVGHSGAGKSTLIKLLLRFYDASEGNIYVDDCPMKSLETESWRKTIALVSQDVYVFNASIRDNIAYGRLDADGEEIIAAARIADAHEFICQLPHGYDTIVGDRGIRLSGGQLQRITLARAIVRNPGVIILDEATNALDSISEQLIQDALEKLSLNCTVIIIAHRLSTIENANQIIVLNKGRVCEQGTFQDLLKLDGYFARLYKVQYKSRSSFM